MAVHRAEPAGVEPHAQGVDDGGTVWLAGGRPDPFRAEGVPDRLVISLHREGLSYVGKLVTWEYRAIDVSRRGGPEGRVRVWREMVVDVSTPHEAEVLVQMYQRPTTARLVAELVTVLRGMISGLAGRDRRMPPRPAAQGEYDSRHVVTRSAESTEPAGRLYGVQNRDVD